MKFCGYDYRLAFKKSYYLVNGIDRLQSFLPIHSFVPETNRTGSRILKWLKFGDLETDFFWIVRHLAKVVEPRGRGLGLGFGIG
jgi:hypothetical protein